MTTQQQLRNENAALRRICADLHWMARRYAEGRMTFSPQVVNDATRYLLSIGVPINPTDDGIIWARDGMGRAYDKLTKEEATPGTAAAMGKG